MCDANYNFTLVDIGAAGRCSDGGIFSNFEMGNGFINNYLNFPAKIYMKTVVQFHIMH